MEKETIYGILVRKVRLSRQLIVSYPEETLLDAFIKMDKNRISHLPIVGIILINSLGFLPFITSPQLTTCTSRQYRQLGREEKFVSKSVSKLEHC